MEALSPGVTGRRCGDNRLEPLAASPREACVLLNVGMTRLYQLMHTDELESYLDGGSRRITMESIRRRLERLLAGSRAPDSADKAHRRRPPSPKRTRSKPERSRAVRPSRRRMARTTEPVAEPR